MSTTTKRPRAEALAAAHALSDLLCHACERWEIAGSVRRNKPEVGDVEHVILPTFGDVPGGDLFASPQTVNLLWHRLDQLVAAGTVAKALINGSPRWGERYRRVIFQGIAHDLFAADADNWGSVLAIRTGPAEFSKGLVVGLRRNGYRNQDGYVWTCTPEGEPIERVACPDERTFFALAGAAWVEPEDRR